MYIEVKTVDGVKYYRVSPRGKWRPINETHSFIKPEDVNPFLNEKQTE